MLYVYITYDINIVVRLCTLNICKFIYLAIPYMTTDTANPANIISNQTPRDKGSKNANKLTDFSGALTKRILTPSSRKGIEKSTTFKIKSFVCT